jgi:hypothetical protein
MKTIVKQHGKIASRVQVERSGFEVQGSGDEKQVRMTTFLKC